MSLMGFLLTCDEGTKWLLRVHLPFKRVRWRLLFNVDVRDRKQMFVWATRTGVLLRSISQSTFRARQVKTKQRWPFTQLFPCPVNGHQIASREADDVCWFELFQFFRNICAFQNFEFRSELSLLF